MSLKDIEAETRLEACYGRVGSGKKINDKPARGGAREVASTATSRNSVGLGSYKMLWDIIILWNSSMLMILESTFVTKVDDSIPSEEEIQIVN